MAFCCLDDAFADVDAIGFLCARLSEAEGERDGEVGSHKQACTALHLHPQLTRLPSPRPALYLDWQGAPVERQSISEPAVVSVGQAWSLEEPFSLPHPGRAPAVATKRGRESRMKAAAAAAAALAASYLGPSGCATAASKAEQRPCKNARSGHGLACYAISCASACLFFSSREGKPKTREEI